MVKPFVKWVGGKRQLLVEIKKLMPLNFNNYFEPFIGGGALFFDLKPVNATINDYNTELVNLYQVVKNNPEGLIKSLDKHENNCDYFYEIRKKDRDKDLFNQMSDLERASRFIYLNRSGFNGFYRVNKKNEFNVPFGKYKNPKYCDPENLKECSNLLGETKILNGDFNIIKDLIKKEDFVYFDPPYVPLNLSSFTSYTDKGFDGSMQQELKELCNYIQSIGAYFMMSNSYTDFILELYKEYNINRVFAKRSINSKATEREPIKEVIVTNY